MQNKEINNVNLKFYLCLNVWIKKEFHFHATPHVLLGIFVLSDSFLLISDNLSITLTIKNLNKTWIKK